MFAAIPKLSLQIAKLLLFIREGLVFGRRIHLRSLEPFLSIDQPVCRGEKAFAFPRLQSFDLTADEITNQPAYSECNDKSKGEQNVRDRNGSTRR
jgi:hypothetical protein